MYHKRLDYVRWAVVVVVLLLLVIGVYLYLTTTHHQSGREGVVRGREEGKGREREGKGQEREGKKGGLKNKKDAGNKPPKVAKSDAAGKPGNKETQNKVKSKSSKQNSSKNSKRSSTKPGGKEVPTISMDDVRLLRRPVLPTDADRPYVIEILNGDNLLLEKRYSEALEKFNEVLKMFPQSPRGLFGKGETLAGLAEQKSSNKLKDTAIEFYQDAANSFLATKELKVRWAFS